MNPNAPDLLTSANPYAKHWNNITLGGSLRRWGRLWPTRTAAVDPFRRITFRDLDLLADQIAAGFADLGVRRGDRVVVQLPNRVEFLEVWFGLQRLGAVPVHAMPAHRRDEIAHLAATSEAVALVVGERQGRFDFREMADQVCAFRAETGSARMQIIVVGDPGAAHRHGLDQLRARGAQMIATASRRPANGAPADPTDPVPSLLPVPGPDPDDPDGPAPGDLALLQISGGTTGRPKLIPRSHTDFDLLARLAIPAAGFDTATVYLAILPAAFNFTMVSPGVLGTLIAGGTVVFAPDPAPATAFDLIAAERVTHTALTPALVPHWLEEARERRADLATLRVVQVGGARLSEELARAAGPALGVTIQQVYGMAEGLVCYTALDDPPELIATTQGRPVCPDDELRIVRPGTTDEVATGELITRGPATLRAYYNSPGTDSSFTAEGFYRTGDEVTRLPSGHLVVVGRVKDQINRGGEKYAAIEIEDQLGELPGVRAVAIVSVPDPVWGEAAVAVLVHDGPLPTVRALAGFLRERGVAAYKAPQQVHSIDDLPLTPVGKVDKQALRALLTR